MLGILAERAKFQCCSLPINAIRLSNT